MTNVQLWFAIPALAVVVAVNSVINFMRYKSDKNGNGDVKLIVTDLKEGQKKFYGCFEDIGKSNVKQELYLEQMVQELHTLNEKLGGRR